MSKPRLRLVSPDEKIQLDKSITHEERIIMFLRLIRYSRVVAEAGAKNRSKR
jgi:hypothetical protein